MSKYLFITANDAGDLQNGLNTRTLTLYTRYGIKYQDTGLAVRVTIENGYECLLKPKRDYTGKIEQYDLKLPTSIDLQQCNPTPVAKIDGRWKSMPSLKQFEINRWDWVLQHKYMLIPFQSREYLSEKKIEEDKAAGKSRWMSIHEVENEILSRANTDPNGPKTLTVITSNGATRLNKPVQGTDNAIKLVNKMIDDAISEISENGDLTPEYASQDADGNIKIGRILYKYGKSEIMRFHINPYA